MAALLAPCVGITRIRFKGSSHYRTSQPFGSPAVFTFRIRPARCKSMPRRIVAAFVSNADSSRGACRGERLFNHDALLPAVSRYCDAASCFMLVWKIAIHVPFFCFHTEPAL